MAIEHRRLGSTGALVSNLCLGTMNFGWKTEEADSFTIMDRALESGVNFFDTADVYGIQAGDRGRTEEIVGRWLATDGGGFGSKRESVVLATKVYNPVTRKGRRPEPNRDTRSLSAMKIVRHCEDRRSGEGYDKRVEKQREQLAAWESLCGDLDESPADVAVAWLLHNPIVTAPIIGPRTMEQLDGAAHATDIHLDEATLTKLDEIFPGPGGEAPEAYAW